MSTKRHSGQSLRRRPGSPFPPGAGAPPASTFHPPPSVPFRPGGADGIALVMVLGVLSLMMIMAVAFAISMSSARLASGNYADTVRARQLAEVGLARALGDIRQALGADLAAPGARVYPDWPATNAIGGQTNPPEYATLLQGTAANFIPRALLGYATPEIANRWAEVVATNADGETHLIGRVGYLIVNCSGLLDANTVGGGVRGFGTNPAEIAVAAMPEVGAGANNLAALRDPPLPADVRYETVEELRAYSSDSTPSNFFVYSYIPPGWWNGSTSLPVVNLAGEVGELTTAARKNAILGGFVNAGYSGAEAGVLYSNLVDYVDNDSFPWNPVAGVEPVPMVNEVVVSNRVELVSDPPPTYRSVAQVAVEWWHPFAGTGGTYRLRTSATFAWISGAAGLLPASFANQVSLPFTVNGPALAVVPIPAASGPVEGNSSVRFRSTITVEVLNSAGVPVDSSSVVLTNASSAAGCDFSAIEFIDPRFNANAVDARYTALHTLYATNACTTNWWAANPGFDTDASMYVANRNLRVAGEVGFLAYAPWRTVKLYGPNRRPVLDAFALGTNAAETNVASVRRGLVNPNSRQADALAAAFADLPVDEYPGGPSSALPWAAALNIAAQLQEGGDCTNVADIGGALTNFAALAALGPALDNELQKESLFRNAAGLLSPRQNVFTVIIESQLAYGGVYPRYKNLSHRRAVAVVWRDPYTGELFVRSFLWLPD